MLVTYAKTLAWYGATPEKAKKSRIDTINEAAERAKENGIDTPVEVHLPTIPAALEPILGFFHESGQVMQSGMGIAPLSWQEITSYREENAVDMTLFERRLLRQMSEAYCSEYHRASDPKRPPPYNPEVEEAEIDHVGDALRMREKMKLLKTRKEQ